MQTLIELYDERAIENVLAVEVMKPEKVVYICPHDVAEDSRTHKLLKRYFESRGISVTLEFICASLYKSDHILEQLRKIADLNPDCAIDVTGGTDAALFAAGMICSERNIPAFTYSRKNNRFYDINHAPFADNLDCTLNYSASDFFRMAGGTMREGRVDNKILFKYIDSFEDFFGIFLRHKNEWVDFITFMQRISQCSRDEEVRLSVCGSNVQKGEHGRRVEANPAILKGMERIDYIRDLKIASGQVTFTFTDAWTRAWLRDVGSVLELYMYKQCTDTGIFNDVVSSAIVDWDGTVSHDSVSNEIDVMAARGVVPLFISCKVCDIKTEAINELAILRDRFGGKGAKAIITTTEHCNSAARHRAAELNMAVIDIEELEAKTVPERLRHIMKA